MHKEIAKFGLLKQLHDLEIINLGTGMGYYDFRYDDIPVKAFNFSLPQQNLYFDYQLLKEYSYKMKRNCLVCIVLPYCIFCADRLEEAMQQYQRYYAILPSKVVEPYCGVPYEEWVLKNEEVSAYENFFKVALKEDEMRRQVEETLRNWERQLGIISFASGAVSDKTIEERKKARIWLKKILEYCEKMQFIPVILIPPMSWTLLDGISRKFRKLNFYDVIDETVPGNIQILDYSQDNFFCNPKLYGWPGFLTESAANVFTKDVADKLGVV